jgi:hypothetical protein
MAEQRKPRGGWSNPASAENGRKAADSPNAGRPQQETRQEVRLRVGGRAIVQERMPEGSLPIQPGRITHLRTGEITITMDDGRVIKVFYENPTPESHAGEL